MPQANKYRSLTLARSKRLEKLERIEETGGLTLEKQKVNPQAAQEPAASWELDCRKDHGFKGSNSTGAFGGQNKKAKKRIWNKVGKKTPKLY